MPAAALEKIRERAPAFAVETPQDAPSKPDENDPYADYQVPDDLIW